MNAFAWLLACLWHYTGLGEVARRWQLVLLTVGGAVLASFVVFFSRGESTPSPAGGLSLAADEVVAPASTIPNYLSIGQAGIYSVPGLPYPVTAAPIVFPDGGGGSSFDGGGLIFLPAGDLNGRASSNTNPTIGQLTGTDAGVVTILNDASVISVGNMNLDTSGAVSGQIIGIAQSGADEVDIGSNANHVQFTVRGQGVAISGNGGDAVLDQSGPQRTMVTNSGGGSVVVDPSGGGELDLGNDHAAEPLINIGDQNVASTQVINIGGAATTTLFVQSSQLDLEQTSTDFIKVGLGSGQEADLTATALTFTPGGMTLTSATNTLDFGSAQVNGNTTGFLQLNATGSVVLENGTSTIASIQQSGFVPIVAGTLSCGAGGTVTVAAKSFGIPVTSGTLTSNCIIDFTTNAFAGLYMVDLSGATLGATFGVQFKNGTATRTYTSAGVISGTLAVVWTHGANTLAVNF